MATEARTKLISIVIPTLGRRSLARTLESVRALAGDFEIIVCADSNADHSRLQKITTEKIFASPGPGANRARNEGARQSSGDVIWFLDDDTEVFHLDAIETLSSVFRDHTIIAAGGEYCSAPSSRFSERGYNAFCSVWRASAGIENRELLLGGTIAVRKVAFDAVGGFDAHIEYGGAETPFVQRLNAWAEVGQSVVFSHKLDVTHRPASRGASGWIRVAMAQGQRMSKTSAALPRLTTRIARALRVVRRQDLSTKLSLFFFGIPFIAISRFAVLTRR